MSQYLGDISAYALAVSQGYTGTEEEYAELMASYAIVGQTAVTAAQTATTKASEAATSATTATNKASEATTAATTATNKAAEAQADADAAALDASQALSAASTATTKATEATTAAATAVSAKDDAVSANTAAQSAKTAAQTAQTGAETAATSVEASAAQIQENTDSIDQLMSEFTATNTELADVRVGADGTTYNSVGAAVRGQISDLKNDLGNANITDLFVVEGLGITVNGWDYGPSIQRVGTKQGVTLHCKVGDKLGLTDYSNARFYLGWRRIDGTYGVSGWKTSDFTVYEEGDYVVTIANLTDVDQTGHVALASLFKYQAVAFDWINDNKTALESLTELPLQLSKGYIGTDGSHGAQSDTKEVYTQTFPCENGQTFTLSHIMGGSYQAWITYALYDERKNCIGRFYVLVNAQYIEYYRQIKVNNANARYIAFSWRTYDDCEAHLYTNTTETLFKLTDDFINWNNVFKARVNDNVKGINHRGFNTVAPENTIPAFKLSKKNGFDIVETDVYFTSDGVAVCLHDGTINRTARNADGTTLSSTINIADITYEQALTYDFGIWKGEEYAGTKIPTFKEFLETCKKIGLKAYIELKAGTEIQIQSLVDMVNDCGMTNYVSWISFSTTYLGYIKAVDNNARLGVITSPLAQNIIADINNLKTTENEVFVDQNNGNITDEIVQMCKDNELPLEVWTINLPDILNTIDPYVTGVTSDSIVAGYELFRINI